jgi:hypothetical protein
MENCKPARSPTSADQDLDVHLDSPEVDKTRYQEILGSLLFLANGSRPDVAFAVTNLARFSNNPKEMHMAALKVIMRYVKGTRDLCLTFNRGNPAILTAQSDASWGVTSFSGFCIYLGGNLVVWKVRKQQMVAMSSCEAELIALTACTQEIEWAFQLCREFLGAEFQETVELSTDSQSAMSVINAVGMHGRSRHYRRLIVYLQTHVGNQLIHVKYLNGKSLISDLLTKSTNGNVLKTRVAEFGLEKGELRNQ